MSAASNPVTFWNILYGRILSSFHIKRNVMLTSDWMYGMQRLVLSNQKSESQDVAQK